MAQVHDLIVKEGSTIKEVMKVMDCTGFSIAFVAKENDILCGVLTDGDVRRALMKGMDVHSAVDKVMNRNPVVFHEGVGLQEVEKIISQSGLRFSSHSNVKIPIVDAVGKVKDALIYSVGQRKVTFLHEVNYVNVPLESIRTVLVVGGAGYLGSVICRKLLAKKYNVRVLDTLLFGEEPILCLRDKPGFEFIHGDVRNIGTITKALSNVDAVIHLAAIVGDPAGQHLPTNTIETNYLATMTLAQACKYQQINRFIFASTCSVYGMGNYELDELAPLNPVSLYARSKIESEKGILTLTDENFLPTVLRLSTLHGLSPRMRFDLVVNTFAMNSMIDKKITLFNGDQWRPFLHVDDAATAFIKTLEAPLNKVGGQVFNVGGSSENYQIKDVAHLIKEINPDTTIELKDTESKDGLKDRRDYKVCFTKIKDALGFVPEKTVKQSLLEIQEAITSGKLVNPKDQKYRNSE